MKIPTYSSTIRRKEMDAVLTCMVAEKTGPGDINIKLIQTVKEYFGVDGAVALRSPSLALKYALDALALPKGEKVILSALAPVWQLQTVLDLSYEPLVIDTDPDTAQMTVAAIEEAIQNGGRVVVLHEAMGRVPDIMSICALGMPVIEDISHNAGASIAFAKEKTATGTVVSMPVAANAPSDEVADAEIEQRKIGTFGVFSILGLEEQDILTAGGGAVLMAANRRDWIALKKRVEGAPSTDILPDINCALGFVQLKELNRNEEVRKQMHTLYLNSTLQGRHKTLMQIGENVTPMVYSFPVVLSSGFKEVKQYASRKEIDIELAFSKSIVACHEEQYTACVNAKSLVLRCVLFPLYPRLGQAQAAKIAKVLATLP